MNIEGVLQKWFGSNWVIINWLLSSIAVVLAVAGIFFFFVCIALFVTRNNKEDDNQRLKHIKKLKTCAWITLGCFVFPVAWPLSLLIANGIGVGKIFDDLPITYSLLGVLWEL